jgi:hypothetical protein
VRAAGPDTKSHPAPVSLPRGPRIARRYRMFPLMSIWSFTRSERGGSLRCSARDTRSRPPPGGAGAEEKMAAASRLPMQGRCQRKSRRPRSPREGQEGHAPPGTAWPPPGGAGDREVWRPATGYHRECWAQRKRPAPSTPSRTPARDNPLSAPVSLPRGPRIARDRGGG